MEVVLNKMEFVFKKMGNNLFYLTVITTGLKV
jgi:hypothetical protein